MESVLALHWMGAYRAGFIEYAKLRVQFDTVDLIAAGKALDRAEDELREVKND
jgi:hypothetical protein